ncbi:MAG: hypothetical protein [Circular genetic element sp.]|nr:MAG: hypothetical protein [Circular genetic element sp.]AXQ65330.1 MAG: hypothetical protein [Circular genetic element sp.]
MLITATVRKTLPIPIRLLFSLFVVVCRNYFIGPLHQIRLPQLCEWLHQFATSRLHSSASLHTILKSSDTILDLDFYLRHFLLLTALPSPTF